MIELRQYGERFRHGVRTGRPVQRSVNKSLLLSALTIDAGTLAAARFSAAGTGGANSFAAANSST